MPAERGAATRYPVAEKVVGVDAIGIKVRIPEAQAEPALSRYGLTVDNDEERYIYVFDTPDLDLFEVGMIARARRIVGVWCQLVPEREIEFFDTSAIRAASSVAAFLVFAAHYGEWEPHK